MRFWPRRKPVGSPCRGVCRLGEEDRLCVGCRRSAAEIARWGRMSHSERVAVLRAVAARPAAAVEAVPLDRAAGHGLAGEGGGGGGGSDRRDDGFRGPVGAPAGSF